MAPWFEISKAADGNNQAIGTSPMYASEPGRDARIAAVKAGGATATVRDNA